MQPARHRALVDGSADRPGRTAAQRVALIDPAAFTLVYDHALAQALSDRGHDVDLLTSHYPFSAMPPQRGYGVSLCFARHPPALKSDVRAQARRVARHAIAMSHLPKIATGYDLLHFQWFALPLIDQLFPFGDRPVVFTAHDVVRRETPAVQRRAQLQLCRRADLVIVHYRQGRDRLREAGVPEDRIRVIPIGAYDHLAKQDYEEPLPPDLEEHDGPVVLFFGVIRPNKGVDVLLDAWSADRPEQLWIVGSPNMDISGLVAGAPANVRFIQEWVTESQLPSYFRRADLVVLPYTDIDQSGVALTAIAFGKPLLLTDVGGFSDLAADGAASLVPPGDAAALRRALDELLSDEAARERLTAGARACAAEHYSWDRIAALTESAYNDAYALRS